MSAGFTLPLPEDQQALRTWLHELSTDVVRPGGREWDEREETPWPVLQEAATSRLSNLDAFAGDGGDDSADSGDSGDSGNGNGTGTVERIGERVPQCFGTEGGVTRVALAVSEPGAGSDVGQKRREGDGVAARTHDARATAVGRRA